LAGQELLGVGRPTPNELVGAEEQHGADRRLIERAGVEEAWHRRLGNLKITRRQVNLSQAPIGQGDVDLHKQEDASEPAFLAKTGLGPFGSGNSAPNDALLLGQLPPAGGNSAEIVADGHLSRGTRVGRHERLIAVGAIAVALPDCVPAFPRLRVGHFHINYATCTITGNAYQKGRHLSSLESQPFNGVSGCPPHLKAPARFGRLSNRLTRTSGCVPSSANLTVASTSRVPCARRSCQTHD